MDDALIELPTRRVGHRNHTGTDLNPFVAFGDNPVEGSVSQIRRAVAVIAAWIGHKDASLTMRLYAHSHDDAWGAP